MPWLSLSVTIDSAFAEALSEALLEAGAESSSIEQPESAALTVSALLPADGDAASILGKAASLCGLASVPAFKVGRLDDDDWVRRAQSQFAPLEIGTRLWIGPSWCSPPREVAAAVQLDPGLAFGTGSHPTTRLVLAYIERQLLAGDSVLDYGCGSGILAIAAAKLGAGRVDAVDHDPQAVAVARHNAARNSVAISTCTPEALEPAQYNLVVSNILAEPLIMLAPLLAARRATRARIALSGILQSQAQEVAQAYRRWYRIAVVARDEPWVLLAGERK